MKLPFITPKPVPVSEITQYTNDIATMVEMRAKARTRKESDEFSETIRIMREVLDFLLLQQK